MFGLRVWGSKGHVQSNQVPLRATAERHLAPQYPTLPYPVLLAAGADRKVKLNTPTWSETDQDIHRNQHTTPSCSVVVEPVLTGDAVCLRLTFVLSWYL